jgi:hypothetical protein
MVARFVNGGEMKAFVFFLIACTTGSAQDRVIRNQEWCAKKAEANLRATKQDNPKVAETIKTFMYEYSVSHHACVAVIQYRTQKDGKPYDQVLARNLATNQTMKGYDEIYLIPSENEKEIQDAITFLFREYGK